MNPNTFSTDRAAFVFRQGTRPLLISMPHAGTYLPSSLAERMTEEARQVPDTDWHMERLYDFADALGASVLGATHSRYCIDLNRPPDGASLYPGQSVTGLCPTDTFDDTPVYADPALQPSAHETEQRLQALWKPYHAKLAHELERIKAAHGMAALWDAHSIRSVLPRFFEGKLTDLNIGTAKGASCDPATAEAVLQLAQESPLHSAVLNGRFTGGYITRQYGNPAERVHAIQLEMTQCSYMQEAMPFDYLPHLAVRVQPVVRRMVETLLNFVEAQRP